MKSNKLLVFVISLTLSGWSMAGTINKPSLSTTYQDSFAAAWSKTEQGELPVYECAQVVGTASKMLSAKEETNLEAQHAYKACYVDAILNYSEAFFKQHNHSAMADDNKPNGCSLYARYLTGHVVSLEVYAERFGLSTYDLNQEISEKLREPASLCEVALN